jgi:hypothetical protein
MPAAPAPAARGCGVRGGRPAGGCSPRAARPGRPPPPGRRRRRAPGRPAARRCSRRARPRGLRSACSRRSPPRLPGGCAETRLGSGLPPSGSAQSGMATAAAGLGDSLGQRDQPVVVDAADSHMFDRAASAAKPEPLGPRGRRAVLGTGDGGIEAAIDELVDLGDRPGAHRPGRKVLTLMHALVAGGDCIDEADVLRTGRPRRCSATGVMAPSTLGTFLGAFTSDTSASWTVWPRPSWAGRGRLVRDRVTGR